MFLLLSRLPQLSLKRSSQSTCLLIHLKLSNKRTPQCLSISLSSPSLFLPLFPHFFHNKLLFIVLFPQYDGFFFLSASVCTNLSCSPSVCVLPPASPHLSALHGFSGESPPPHTHTSLLTTPPPFFAAGYRKRKNEKG